jgi:hypothetical protein
MYAVNEGVEWMIRTNGQVWQVWHLTAGLPVELTMALEVDLLGDGGPTRRASASARAVRAPESMSWPERRR